ncbi:MAG: hypothetical protein KIT20_08405 [Alphaproteobacteria bacterium]|nr:hypothetical protein [Alphaproteobacteria bacterium]
MQRRPARARLFRLTAAICLVLFAAGCNTMRGVGHTIEGIGKDVRGTTNAVQKGAKHY